LRTAARNCARLLIRDPPVLRAVIVSTKVRLHGNNVRDVISMQVKSHNKQIISDNFLHSATGAGVH